MIFQFDTMVFSIWCKAAPSTDKFTRPNYIVNQGVDVCFSNSQGIIQDSYGPKYQWIPSSWCITILYGPNGSEMEAPNLCQLVFPHLMRDPNYYHNVPFLIVTVNVCYQQSASNVLVIDPILTGHHHPQAETKRPTLET